ncbi:phosphatase PAP2 family protein [Chitinophaga sp.]|uniref:phosphatase PAP2 family protein n=1 Tax=Chitinophaga sp. TaxID=1869181 RepID=UPI0031D8819D
MLWPRCLQKNYILFFLFLCAGKAACAQSDTGKIYSVNWKYELPIPVAALTASYFGFQALDRTSAYKPEDLNGLNPDRINRFDRPVAFNNPALFKSAQKSSDLFLNISILSPVALMLDRRIRKDWLDLLSMYLVSHAVDNAIYFGAAFPIRRTRPYVYNPQVAEEEKVGIAKSNSFFSGHVSFAATSTFFLAKVYTDYHQIKGLKRVAIYSAAAVPPALVGFYRVRAGKHFRTDVILGFLIGASTGIVVPELHRRIRKNERLSISPFYGQEGSGLSLHVKI